MLTVTRGSSCRSASVRKLHDDIYKMVTKRTPEEEELSRIFHLIYGDQPNSATDAEAVQRLHLLVDRQVPEALTIFANLLWHGYGVEKDVERAFALASQAADLGDLNALVLLASMHFEGAGCERNLAKSLELITRFDNEAPSLPIYLQINEVGPGYFNFYNELTMRVNGSRAAAPLEVLEEFLNWVVDCKRKVIAKQSAIIKRNPGALGGRSHRRLPYKGSIGGSIFLLKGKETISHLGVENGLVGEQIWFETSRFIGWPKGVSFGDLTEFNSTPATELDGIRSAYHAHKSSGKPFLLKLTSSSVHRASTFYCGDEEVMSGYED
jgi:hypothetical protein